MQPRRLLEYIYGQRDKRALGVVDLRLADKQSVREATLWLATLMGIAVQLYSIPAVLALEDGEVTQSILRQCNQCLICSNGYKEGMVVSRLPCKHTFHRQCVVSWLCNKDFCPLCRRTTVLASSM